ncbi:MAG: cupin domain-containing protein [Actinobacteria bacterium]|nr:cupin domain-containing protein [Actinomycetota bacterium]MBU1864999.1 cupin domain-containing protein [Actinomycetota bacterium]
MDGSEVAALLGLAPLPHEGGMWAQTWIDDLSTAIYFLMQPGDFSAMHRLDGPEIWHHYAGAPVRLVLLHADGKVGRPMLGDDLGAGERPCIVVPTGDWMGAETMGEWSLVGTTMAPGYRVEGFELGDRDDLIERYPQAAADIVRLTREGSP